MSIKKTVKALFLTVCLSGTGFASAGIPVADGLGLAQSIAMSMAEQMMHEMLAEARNKLTEELAEKGFDLDKELADRAEDFAWEMYEQTVEKYGYGWLYEVGSTEIYTHMETYTEISRTHTSDGSFQEALERYRSGVNDDYRKREGMFSKVEHVQKSMDKDLLNKRMQEAALAEISKRYKLIEELRRRADQAVTPQQKEDLKIAIGIEQAAIMLEQNRLNTLNNISELERETEMYRTSNDIKKAWDQVEFSYSK